MGVKKYNLGNFFRMYALKVIAVPIVIIAIAIFVSLAGLSTGIILPANYESDLVNQIAFDIENAEIISAEMIPAPLEYMLVDKDTFAVIDKGNMEQATIDAAQEFLAYGRNLGWNWNNQRFKVIEGKNEVCVIKYNIIVKFSNSILARVLPYPWILMVVCSLFAFIGAIYVLSKWTAVKITGELQKILDTTRQIEQQNLNFVSEENQFREFQTVANSLDRMRDALKLSLQEQIELEASKSNQVGALAHDVKIPLTIIKGNAELLTLTQQSGKQKEFTEEILDASMQIEDYTRTLVDVSKLHSPFTLQKKMVSLWDFLENVENEITAFSRKKSVSFIMNVSFPKETMISVDPSLFHRALMNILCNGVEHTEMFKEVTLSIMETRDNSLTFYIQDQGDGFSKEALEKGTEIFYTKNTARSNDGHYGIGLSFAKQVVKAHSGKLLLQNNDEGGLVQLIFSSQIYQKQEIKS